MNRAHFLHTVHQKKEPWDVVIIGGGATGLGCAVDAASRGYSTVLLEMHDFAKGTSSRSTKLIHGGVRYLQQGDVSLVIEALKERGLLIQNAPHLVGHQSFIVPSYKWWNGPFYGIGMKVYDMLAGELNIHTSKSMSVEETLHKIPTLETEGLLGGTMYYDGQFDDSRLAINLAQTAHDHGAIPLNYVQVTGLHKNQHQLIQGVEAFDVLNKEAFTIHGRVMINATGIFTDPIMNMDNESHTPIIQCSQGIHVVLDRSFLPGDTAIMVPHTEDGRVLFAVPWHGKVLVGTTDTPVEHASLEPKALAEEIDFILRHATKYLSKDPTIKDVKSVFAGLRPLIKAEEGVSTSKLSRSHHLHVSESGLVTITGGKWTTYRKMAEDTIDKAITIGHLKRQECITTNLKIHGWQQGVDWEHHLHVYGADRSGIESLIAERSELGEKIHPNMPYLKAEVIWACSNEMAMTVDDVLSRRTRMLLLDAKAAIESAEHVAVLMADELGEQKAWVANQVKEFKQIAKQYILI